MSSLGIKDATWASPPARKQFLQSSRGGRALSINGSAQAATTYLQLQEFWGVAFNRQIFQCLLSKYRKVWRLNNCSARHSIPCGRRALWRRCENFLLIHLAVDLNKLRRILQYHINNSVRGGCVLSIIPPSLTMPFLLLGLGSFQNSGGRHRYLQPVFESRICVLTPHIFALSELLIDVRPDRLKANVTFIRCLGLYGDEWCSLIDAMAPAVIEYHRGYFLTRMYFLARIQG